ncbi:hypothetical protein B0H10DRAFT_1956777 [Mycena sp. CBHHK59/15]|nr:hypothetical protein B0H10DRAFT_1956777 [Mycena sp. CBHHK59/15]
MHKQGWWLVVWAGQGQWWCRPVEGQGHRHHAVQEWGQQQQRPVSARSAAEDRAVQFGRGNSAGQWMGGGEKQRDKDGGATYTNMSQIEEEMGSGGQTIHRIRVRGEQATCEGLCKEYQSVWKCGMGQQQQGGVEVQEYQQQQEPILEGRGSDSGEGPAVCSGKPAIE